MSVDDSMGPAQAPENGSAARAIRRTLRQWPWIIAFAILAAGAAYALSSSRAKVYNASTQIQLNSIDLGKAFLGQSLNQDGNTAGSQTATYAQLVTSARVREVTSRRLGGKVSTTTLANAVTAGTVSGTTLITITASANEPLLAAEIADATRDSFVMVRAQGSMSQLNRAKEELNRQYSELSTDDKNGAAGKEIHYRIKQLDLLRAVSDGGVETVQTARVPGSAVSPNPIRDAALAGFAALLLGLGVALLRAKLDGRVRDPEELSEVWDLPVLGLIPESKALSARGRDLPTGPVVEAFALARTNLRYLHVGADVQVLAVTSAGQGEGKSTTVWNLAVAAALAGSSVLVIEADLRRPVLSPRLGVTPHAGLSELLAGISTFRETIIRVTYGAPKASSEPVAEIDVIFGGTVPPSPVALLERPEMGAVLDEAKSRYDLVVIDTPPATVVADAKLVAHHADGVLIVSRLGVVRRSTYKRLRDLLWNAGPPVLGLVVNGVGGTKAYGYESVSPSDQARERSAYAGSGVSREITEDHA